MKTSIFLTVMALLACRASAQNPGGVSANLRWWLKADAGVLNPSLTPAADGDLVANWNDQNAVTLNHATQGSAANRPEYRTNVINGNPVLRFSSNQFLDGGVAPGITNAFCYFLVFKQTTYTAGTTSDGAGTYLIDRSVANNPLTSFKIVNTNKYHLQKRNDAGGVEGPISISTAVTGPFVVLDYYRDPGVALGIILNGRTDATSSDGAGALNADPIRVGRHATAANGGINGDIAEIAVYNTNITLAEKQQVESYLAIKYGITLDQTIARDYTSADGTVIYPATLTHDSYDNDIAGIGRDDLSGLNQTASQSQNTLSVLRIFNPSSLDDKDYLMWGHDSPNIWNSTNAPPGYLNRLTRVWRAAESNDVGTVSISFDLSSLGVDTSDPTKFALLIDGDGNFTDATVHITGRSVVSGVVSFTGADLNNNDFFTIATDAIPGPGGVAAPVFWLRADLNAYTDAGSTLATNGQTIQQWNNQGNATYNVSQSSSTRRPTFVTNIFNGNPVLRFTSAGATHTNLDFGSMGIASTSDLNFSMVFRPSLLNGGTVGDGTGGYIVDRAPTSPDQDPLVGLKLLSTGRIGFQKRADDGSGLGGVSTTTSLSLTAPQIVDYQRDVGVRYGIFHNGTLEGIQTPESDGAITVPNLRIGTHYDGDKGFNGDISEFIFYNRDLTTNERNRVDSYLALKYGITLTQTTSTNYTASDGTVIYPATTTHSGYKNNIAGIGIDPTSRLTQTSSQSVNTGSMVLVQSPSSMTDFEFFLWGHNNGSITLPNMADVGAPIMARLSRVWKAAETGDVGTTTISFDLTNVPGTKVQADLRLIVDRNLNGFADNDMGPFTGTLVGEIFTVTGINLQHGDLFTIGTTNITTTPLPVQFISFDAQPIDGVVHLNWLTASERNNDFYTIERSADGEHFMLLNTVTGAGTTDLQSAYHSLDPIPLQGTSYYRLLQTDLDGSEKILAVKKIEINEANHAHLYPNPSHNGEFSIVLPEENISVAYEIISITGKSVYSSVVKPSQNHFDVKPTDALAPGIYIVRLVWRDQSTTLKLVVE